MIFILITLFFNANISQQNNTQSNLCVTKSNFLIMKDNEYILEFDENNCQNIVYVQQKPIVAHFNLDAIQYELRQFQIQKQKMYSCIQPLLIKYKNMQNDSDAIKCLNDIQDAYYNLATTHKSTNYNNIFHQFHINQYFTRVPGQQILTHKNKLSFAIQQYLSFMKENGLLINESLEQKIKTNYQNDFDIYPTTYILPYQSKRFIEQTKNGKFFIQKKAIGQEGNGIVLGDMPDDFDLKKDSIIQEYEDDILRYKNHKFDVRQFSVVTSVTPIIAFTHHSGFVKMCKHQYEHISIHNKQNKKIHITNLGINDDAHDVNYQTDGGFSGFINLDQFYRELEINPQHFNFDSKFLKILRQNNISLVQFIKNQFHELTTKIFTMVSPQLSQFAQKFVTTEFLQIKKNYFNIFGFDIYFDRFGKAKLFEINGNPTYQFITNKNVYYQGVEILRDTLNLIGIKIELVQNNVSNYHFLYNITQFNFFDTQLNEIYSKNQDYFMQLQFQQNNQYQQLLLNHYLMQRQTDQQNIQQNYKQFYLFAKLLNKKYFDDINNRNKQFNHFKLVNLTDNIRKNLTCDLDGLNYDIYA